MRKIDPRHLIFSIWAVTQHYADFDMQVRAVLGDASDVDRRGRDRGRDPVRRRPAAKGLNCK